MIEDSPVTERDEPLAVVQQTAIVAERLLEFSRRKALDQQEGDHRE